MPEQLFSGNVATYIANTTESQWKQAATNESRWFQHPTLSALLDDLEATASAGQTQVLSRPVQVTWANWLQGVTLQQLQSRVASLNAHYGTLYDANRIAATRQVTATQNRVNDLTQLGVHLYGLGTSDGLYDNDGES